MSTHYFRGAEFFCLRGATAAQETFNLLVVGSNPTGGISHHVNSTF